MTIRVTGDLTVTYDTDEELDKIRGATVPPGRALVSHDETAKQLVIRMDVADVG